MHVAKPVATGIVTLTLATACGSSGQTDSSGSGHYSLSQVKNAFAAQGISLQKQSPQPPAPPGSGAVWLTPAGEYTPIVGVFKSSQDSANGSLPGEGHVVHNGNVVVICRGPCPHDVNLSLQQLH